MNDLNRTGPYQPATVDEAAPATPERIGRYRIKRILGEGGFGIVYLAHDDQLQRLVAIKVPHPHLVAQASDAEAYLLEARTVANLDHPNIVPVHDVGSTEDCSCFIVSKFIDGTDLKTRIKTSRLSVEECAALAATVAETLHFAHKQGIVHRDIKPGNILLDKTGRPFVADFGLALREQDIGKGPRYAGTPAYMSPEQARGEGHRVDGRSDIFSLGVVLYELLTGRRPFRADSRDELLEQITNMDARPPRQWDDAIPNELDRISLKALSKRASERYSTGRDMADDLRHFLAGASVEERSTLTGEERKNAELATPMPSPVPTDSDQQAIKIVPKGLRSFDAGDADFFLELLPGPRDRDGLPDSIRFWKTRMETMDADNTFSVGLIYGPSGCGKSSLVKAGLLPALAQSVTAVYVEATGEETEARLLKGLRRQVTDLPSHLGLVEALAALRQGRYLEAGQKVVLVLDQFEQWLHAKRNKENTELVQALRQCDGERVQCIVMVRDDFWMATTRFLRELEIDLVPGRNTGAADLFNLRHTKKVLTAFGRAFGTLPEHAGELNNEQLAFVEQAVSGLAQENKVICVRLALFAEMMKGRPWTPASLKEVGGTEGVGVTFLEETFSSQTANPKHRLHQKAARAVLKALLPESGTDIKGHMRSHGELLAASGYVNRPKDFDDLIRILDSEIRLATPTDPEGKEGADESQVQPGQKYYQLTHDYLVPSLRDWLTRKQKETRRGRAELLLADRAAVWNARPENRQLPSLPQWLQILWLTQKKNWTPPQRKMMRKASRYHVGQGLLVAVVLALLGWGVFEAHGTLKAHALRDRLLDANTTDVPTIVQDMASYRRWIDPLLHDAYAQAEAGKDARKQLHASLALLPVDASQLEYLYGRLLDAEPGEVPVIRDALVPHKDELLDRLWAGVEAPKKGKESQRLRAAAALAKYDPEGERWAKVQDQVANDFVGVPAVYLATWMESFRPVQEKLLAPLAVVYRDGKRRETERSLATDLLADYAGDQPKVLADLLMDADEKQFATLYPKCKDQGERGLPLLTEEVDRKLPPDATEEVKERLAKRQANAAVALLRMDRAEKVWPLLKHSPDPRARSYLIHRLSPLGADPGAIIRRLDEEPDVTIRRALVLSLGEFSEEQLPSSERSLLIDKLLVIYEHDRDAGLHGAAEWLLRRWGQEARLKPLDDKIRTNEGQLYTVLKAQLTEEQQQRLSKIETEIEAIHQRLTDCEKEFPVRQAVWERRLREQAFPLPASLQEGLIAHYPLDEAEGRQTVNTVKGQPGGKYQGTGKPEWVPGVLGRALRFDGSGTVVGGSPLDLECDQAFSYGCWFQYNATIPMILLSTRDKTKGHRGFDLSLENDHQLRMQIAGEDPTLPEADRKSYSPFHLTVITTTNVDPGRSPGWHHVMVTYDGSKKARGVKIFVEGQPQPTQILSDNYLGTIKSDVPLHIGSRHDAYRFRGEIDDVRIYNRRLSEKEVQQLYESSLHALVHIPAKDRTPEQQKLLADYYRPLDESSRQLTNQLAAAQQSLWETRRNWFRRWYVNGQGQTMVVIPGPMEFVMGSPATEAGREGGPEGKIEQRHKKRIGHSFAIAAKEVTVAQFLRFRKDPDYNKQSTLDCPVNTVTWYDAAAYCNWLSKEEGLPEDQWCYLPKDKGEYAEGMKLAPDYLKRTGYRLPSEAEWEYACRAGAVTSRYFGETEELLGKYVWYTKNSLDRGLLPGVPGSLGVQGDCLKPNDFGLFDMLGNASEWCQESFTYYNSGEDGKPSEDIEDKRDIKDRQSRVLRGGSFDLHSGSVRCAYRNGYVPADRYVTVGLRPARTFH